MINSNFSNFKTNITNNLINVLGPQLTEKYIIIESDDWGSVRMSNVESFNYLLNKGYDVNKNPYCKYDALESNHDLEALFDLLNSIKGDDGKPVKMTLNNIVANPNFEKIRESNFNKYYFEPFTDTLKRYPCHDKVTKLYKEGIDFDLIKPQFHGREHLNIRRWLNFLQNKNQATIDAFNLGVFSPPISNTTGYNNEFMDAFDVDNESEINDLNSIIENGLKIFDDIWGFKSKSFIAPCYIWPKEVEKTLFNNNVKYIQGMVNQLHPTFEIEYKYKKIYHYQGQKNTLGQRYIIRNVFFEPSIKPNFDWESNCMNRIAIAFKYNKPAVISTHRLNFIGFLDENNRTKNLKRFKILLEKIKKKWPCVKFISSDELGEIFQNKDDKK
jgi:hypothetical protein